jgi:hypothetical protein
MQTKYAVLTNVASDIFSIIPDDVGVRACFSLARDVIGWRQFNTTGETLRRNVVVRQCARANNRLLAGDYAVLDSTDTKNDLKMKRNTEQMKLPRKGKVHELLEMRQGNQNLRATQKDSCTQKKQRTAERYLSNTEEIAKASWSNFQHDCAAAFVLSERLSVPPALSARSSLEDKLQY